MAKIKYDTIPNDSIITIKLSGDFYEKLKITLLSITEKVEPVKLLEMIERFKTPQAPEDANEHNIYILLRLIKSIEEEAKKQGLTNIQEIELPD